MQQDHGPIMSAKEYPRDPTIGYIHTNFPKTLSSTHRTTCRHAYWQPYSTVLTATPIVFRFSAPKPGSHSRTGSEPFSLLKKEAGNHFISLAFICTFFGASVNVLQIIFAEGGPNRIIKSEKIVVWQELKREFLSIRATARRTGTDRKTIRKLSGRGLTDKIGAYTDIRRKRLGRP